MGDLDKAVADGAKAAATGTAVAGAVAGTAAAIGAAVGASLGPFAVIAAPIGAVVGALIGFFVSLAGKPSKEELAKMAAAAEAARIETANKAWALGYAAETLMTSVSLSLGGGGRTGNPVKDVEHDITRKGGAADALRAVEQKNPAYTPMIEALLNGFRVAARQPDAKSRSLALQQLKTLVGVFKAFAATPGDISSDPFVYLRPPLSALFGPALKAAGMDISDPTLLEKMRGNYDYGVEEAAKPRRVIGGSAIRRKSVGQASGGKMAIDTRAFAPKIAPYGVGSFAMFPESAPDPSWAGNNQSGFPLQAPWPYGLDADRFALPKPKTVSPKVKVAAAGGAAALGIYLLFFL